MAALEWKPGTEEVKEAAQRWAGQADAAHALATPPTLSDHTLHRHSSPAVVRAALGTKALC